MSSAYDDGRWMYRAAEHRQRSSSVDGDPRSWTAGPVPLDQQKGHKPSHLAKSSQAHGPAAVRAKPPAAAVRVAWAGARPDQTRPSRTASSPGVDKSHQGQHRQGLAKPVNGAVRKEGKASSPLKVSLDSLEGTRALRCWWVAPHDWLPFCLLCCRCPP